MPDAKKAVLVPAEDYKPLLPKGRERAALRTLKSSETIAKATQVIALKRAELRGAVLALVQQMEDAARSQDWPTVFDAAHEIRGLAGTAGLNATGRIANGFCRYLDSLAELGVPPERAVVAVHMDAVARSARTEDDTARHGDAVVQDLAKLVSRKLSEIKDSTRH